MTKKQRRKQKKDQRTIRAAKRRVKPVPKAKAPQFEFDLPMTAAAIEAEIARLLPEASLERPEIIEVGEHERTISLTPTMLRIMRLQKQLFRLVFRREIGPNDPVFWDRKRETHGAFPVDEEEDRHEFAKVLAQSNFRPEIGYAIALTGMMPLEDRLHLYDQEDLEYWQSAVDDYVHQAKTGVPPLAPDELIHALMAANGVVERPNVMPIGIAGYPQTNMNRIIVTLEGELGTHEKAVAAMSRLMALVEITEHDEFRHLMSPKVFSEDAMIAAASAEIDRRTGKFVPESFRERMEGTVVNLS